MARRLLADSALVAVGTLIGNVLSYGFSFALAHQLAQASYGEVGALLTIFLVASIPATAIQAVTARRVARAAAAGEPGTRELTGPLVRWSLLAGLSAAAVLAALSPAVHAALPAVSAPQVAWTALALLPNSLIYCYLGVAQGGSRFGTFTALFLAANGAKLAAGLAAGTAGADPGLIMAAMAGAWFAAAALSHYALRETVGRPSFRRGLGFPREVGAASWSLGAVLVLSLLDGLFAAHYLRGDVLGRYQAGAMFTRAGYFAPQFAGVLAYPRLAVPETRRRALIAAAGLSAGIGALVVLASALGPAPLVRLAFGAGYLHGAGLGLASTAWVFALSGAVQALVQLALLDAVARRSPVVGRLVSGGILAEAATILVFEHRSATSLIATAAAAGSVIAAASLTAALLGRDTPSLRPGARSDYATATP